MARILKFHSPLMHGQDVLDVQNSLNHHNPTRLPRLDLDGDKSDHGYGIMTMARAMEFQFKRSLTTDGACGPKTQHELGKHRVSSPADPSGRCILVDLFNNRLTAFEGGVPVPDCVQLPCHGGSDNPSTRGVFQLTSRRLRHHTSSEFPEPPDNMQFSMFYHKGEAIHLGPPAESSEGCIHVGLPGVQKLFEWAGASNIIVIIAKEKLH
jgi:hypothetical protein